ncbi:hypothetical protein ACJX0J_027671, partial [Zea mays]
MAKINVKKFWLVIYGDLFFHWHDLRSEMRHIQYVLWLENFFFLIATCINIVALPHTMQLLFLFHQLIIDEEP